MRRLHDVPLEILPRPYLDVPLWTMETFRQFNTMDGDCIDAWRESNGIPYGLWESVDEQRRFVFYLYESDNKMEAENDSWIQNVHDGQAESWGIWDAHTLNPDFSPYDRVYDDELPNSGVYV